MQSNLKKVVVYDLETGGLNHNNNSITEFAGVVIDLSNLTIVDQISVTFHPYVDLTWITEAGKDAKTIFKNLADTDAETKIKTLQYRGESLTLKNLDLLVEELDKLYAHLEQFETKIFNYNFFQRISENEELSQILKIVFDNCYNPQALEVTHISIDMLLKEGVKYSDAYEKIKEFLSLHTVGNSKPILAGHNINGFDNDFMSKVFVDNKDDLSKHVNSFSIDTLEWARMKWFELPSYNLGTCSNEVGLTLSEAHRALPDTIATAKFLVKMLQNLRGEGLQESTYQRRKFKMNF